MSEVSGIDNLDLQIMASLMRDAQEPFTEIAKRLGISSGTVHVRMRKLRERGIVTGSRLEIDPTSLGYDISAFVGVFLEKGSFYNEIAEVLYAIPEITEIHYTTGRYSMFLKIVCKNTRELRQVLNDKIQTLPSIQRTETFISLEESMIRPIKILQEDQV
ncbi:MAG: Lrp/AsnC ligand binding domain-containing protein [Bacteroidia bacterium]